MADEINWFPGHMTKTLRSIEAQLKLVDVVIETADARIPLASRNPELNALIQEKPRVLVLNKSDLADPDITSAWISYFNNAGIPVVACDSTRKKGLNQVREKCKLLCADILERAKQKGRIGRPIRAMVVGIPNSGKSTLINSLCNRKIAVTGDRPGVTRGYQWARTDAELELMDMPGTLWPKLGSRKNQLCLTITGAVKMEIVNTIEVAVEAMELLLELYPRELCERFNLPDPDSDEFPQDIYELFLFAAKKRGCILSGGRIDEERYAVLLLEDYRSGRIGRLSLEKP